MKSIVSFILLFIFSLNLFADNKKTYKIGIYHNPPIIFAKNHKASGFAVDIIQRIADKENWKFTYVKKSFSQCMKLLKDEKIDILVGIAYSEQRDEFLDFNKTVLLTYYGQLFVKRATKSTGLLDLKNKTVGIVQGDIFAKNFKLLAKSFRIKLKYKNYNNFKEIFKAVSEGKIFAGAVSILNAPGNEEKYGLKRTPVIFSPINLVYAAKQGRNKYFLNTIDKHIEKLKKDKDSFYYKTYRKYFLTGYAKERNIWKFITPFIALILVLIAVIFGFYYKKRIAKKEERLEQERSMLGRKIEDIDKLIDKRTHELTKRLNHEEALQMFTQALLSSQDYSEAIDMAVNFLFDISMSEQICIYENKKDSNGKLVAELTYCGCFDDSYHCRVPENNIYSYDEKFLHIDETLSNGMIIHNSVKKLDHNIKNFFESKKVLSVLILPVWVAGNWHGFISFENKKKDKLWDGKEVRMLLTASEIIGAYMERKITESALIQSEEKFRNLVEGASNPIFIFNPGDDKILFVNNAMREYFEYSDDEFCNKRIYELFEDKNQYFNIKKANEKKVENNEKIQIDKELIFKTKSGEIKEAMVSGNPIKYGESKAVVVIIKDVTERRRNEKRILERLRYEEALAMCSRSLLAIIEQEDAINLSLNYLLNASDTDTAFIYINYSDGDELRAKFTHEISAENVSSLKDNEFLKDMQYSMCPDWQKEMETGKRIIGNENTLDKKTYKKFFDQGIKSFLFLPIFTGGKWYGFIGFYDLQGNKKWNEEDIQLLNTASNMIGSFLYRRNSEQNLKNTLEELNNKTNIITEDLMMAEKIQLNIVPKNFDEFPGLNIDVYFKPMIQVGGDIYDVFETKKNYFRIFIADATGHGVQAALITMLIKGTYDKIKTRAIAPNEIMRMLNKKYVEEYYNLNVYFTSIIIDFDFNKGKILYSIAGHPPPYLITGKKFEILEGSGFLLGAIPTASFKLYSRKIEKGDKIFVFSDGMYEEFNDDLEELGEERVIEVFKNNSDKNINEIIQAIVTKIYDWIGEPGINDDITIIGLEY